MGCELRLKSLTFTMLFCFAKYADTAENTRNTLPQDGTSVVKTLKQNWTDEEASWFYSVPQGSKVIPYDWFLKLEQPDSETSFREPAFLRKFGYILRSPGPGNPDGLPVGFTIDGAHLGLTCAACHTSQIKIGSNSILIDGAPTLADFEKFQRLLEKSLIQTLSDSAKFDRFANNVLGSEQSLKSKDNLKKQLQAVVVQRSAYNLRNLPKDDAQTSHFGPGRVDAFGAIMNEVTERFAQQMANHYPANAPVSYPFLWDTPQHDKVQWNGAAKNNEIFLLKPILNTSRIGALGRNAGEVLGVFGDVDATLEGTLFQLRGYQSSVNKDNLVEIEERLTTLWSPEWPKDILPFNQGLADRGFELFKLNCQSCHQPIQRDSPLRRVRAEMKFVETDQTMAANFAFRTAKSGVMEGRKAQLTELRRLKDVEPIKDLLVHMVQRVVAWPQQSKSLELVPISQLVGELKLDMEYPIYAEIKIGDKELIGSFNHLNLENGLVKEAFSREALRLKDASKLFQQDTSALDDITKFVAADGSFLKLESLVGLRHKLTASGVKLTFDQPTKLKFAYKGRPLNGIWATAPYLHNGSVPNLDELLKQPEQRVKKFRLGSAEFDPVKVGFNTEIGEFQFDTNLLGNSNAGHKYSREFTEEERRQLIEYMKSL